MENLKQKLIKTIVEHSCNISKSDHVLLFASHNIEESFLEALIKEINSKGAYCYFELINDRLKSISQSVADEEYANFMIKSDIEKYKNCNVRIFIQKENNRYESKIVPNESKTFLQKARDKFFFHILQKRWLYLQFPSDLDAHLHKMSGSEFENFFFNACTIDYSELEKNLQPLKKLMEKTDNVRICGNGTDISFSIKDIPAVICSGNHNIPDGEIYTAPIKNSVNGIIRYNAPHNMFGESFEDIKLTVKDGKIIKVDCKEKADLLYKYMSIDEGGLYFGEFALGVNKAITKSTGNTLFDEKINGSFHLTSGNCYNKANNGNKSCTHEDFVCIQTPEFGGGEIYFDNILIRKDGKFTLKELEILN